MTHNVSIFKASLFVLVSFFQNKVRSWFPFFFILTPISSKLMYRPRAISAVSGGLENRRGRFEPGAFELFSTISWQKNEKTLPNRQWLSPTRSPFSLPSWRCWFSVSVLLIDENRIEEN